MKYFHVLSKASIADKYKLSPRNFGQLTDWRSVDELAGKGGE